MVFKPRSAVGVVAGGIAGFAVAQRIGHYFFAVQLREVLPVVSAAIVLAGPHVERLCFRHSAPRELT